MRSLGVIIGILLITAGTRKNQGPLVIYDVDIQLRTLKIKCDCYSRDLTKFGRILERVRRPEESTDSREHLEESRNEINEDINTLWLKSDGIRVKG
jgi:hypothetical protein